MSTSSAFRPARPVAACALVLAALVARPTAAHAQFGRLRAAAAAAARGAAGDKAQEKAQASAADAGAGGRAAVPTFTEDVLEITEARLARLMRGLDAEAAARPAAERRYEQMASSARANEATYPARLAAWEREHAAWERRDQAREACVQRAQDRHGGEGDAAQASGDALANQASAELTPERQARLEAMSTRLQAAQARGDQVAVRALMDSIQKSVSGVMQVAAKARGVSARASAAGEAARAEARACGDKVAEPERPTPAGFVDASEAQRSVRRTGAAASGLTERQYDVMRERVEAFARMNGRTNRSLYAFSPAEQAALGPQLGALRGRGELTEARPWTPPAEPRS